MSSSHCALLLLLPLFALLGCAQDAGGPLAGAPTAVRATPGNASAAIAFVAPQHSGQSAVSTYIARCSARGATLSGRASASPVRVDGLSNGVAYDCTVGASNSAGTGAPSTVVRVTPQAQRLNTLSHSYRNAPWSPEMSPNYPDECSMTLWPSAHPSHAVNAFYLQPSSAPGADRAALAPASGMKLAPTAYSGNGALAPMSFNTCPSLAAHSTATGSGVIGMLITGAPLYRANEIPGHRATVLTDNVALDFRDARGSIRTAHFIDDCNGHPTPESAGSSYHYHGLSKCVTALVDREGGPSHLIGVALDGFPIYGDRDMQGRSIDPRRLDACNGITSPTPEFSQGVYHYVLPGGVKQANASMRCLSGEVSQQQIAAAQAGAFCYAPQLAAGAGPAVDAMKMAAPARPGA